jgi:hypothetical protein
MRYFFLIFFLASISHSYNAKAQMPVDTTFLDAGPVQEQVKLLPDHLGIIKKTLWGERGLVRIMNLSPLTPEGRAKELKLRRSMLIWHQILGFVTLGSMLTADFSGQMILNGNEQYRSLHSAAVTATIGSYFTTAGLALLAPPPMVIRVKQWDAIRVHRLLAALHFGGMILTPLLAPNGRNATIEDLRNKALFHQISAYTTTAIFATAILVIKF